MVLSILTLTAPNLFSQPSAVKMTVEGLFILATNAKVPADPRLKEYEAELQRNIPESSFKLISQGSSSVSNVSPGVIAFDRLQRVELRTEKLPKPGLHLNVQWMHGVEPVIGGVFTFKPGVPVVLMRRPPTGKGDLSIIILIARPSP